MQSRKIDRTTQEFIEMREEMEKILDCGQFILGEQVAQFEKELAAYYHKEHAIGVNSGTDALWLSLVALGIGRGDEVITTPFTFISPAEVIAQTGATPVFVDINYDDFLLNPSLITKAITDRTKAIMPIHLFGQACDKRIREIADMHNLKVIEDAAQAFGNMDIGWGDTTCFSFHPSKALGAWGDGGAILTDDKKLAEKLRSLRNHGADLSKGAVGKYHNVLLGFNSRLDEIQASVLRVKLRHFGKPFKRLKTFRVSNRDTMLELLEKQGLDVKTYYTKPLHTLPVFEYLGYKEGDFPVAEQATKEVLTLSVYE